MSKRKHAAGPWRLHSTDDTTVVAADGSEVAAIDGDYNDPDLWPIMEANARLIAAAPELVEALAALIRIAPCNADDDDDPEQAAAWRNARALLDRIEGDAP